MARPTKGMLHKAAIQLHEDVKNARAAGERTVLTFVFAGHGDVDKGKGVLELEDARLFPDDLKALLDQVGADVTHVLLDSCNSYFVMYPRRPGGNVLATSADTTGGLSLHTGALGVFLSTSAEAQVFEWTQLESGIFSHVVRSGLAGAADVDGDGRVRYGELRAFVAIATRGMGETPYRPRLFVQGPRLKVDSGDDAVLLDLRQAQGPRLRLEGLSGRVTIRGARGRRIVDVRTEPGFSPTLVALPIADGESIEIMTETESQGRRVVSAAELSPERLTAPTTAAVTPALFSQGGGARGTDQALDALFSGPFGPAAMEAERKRVVLEPPEVYGLTRDQEGRLATQLEVYGDRARSQRLLGAWSSIGMGAGIAAFWILQGSVASSLPHDGVPWRSAALNIAGVAAPPLVIGVTMLVIPSDPEKLVASFREAPHATDKEKLARAAAAIDTLAEDVKEHEDSAKLAALIGYPTGVLAMVLGAAVGVAAGRDGGAPDQLLTTSGYILLGGGAWTLAVTTGSLLWSHPPEKYLIDEMRGDPASIFPALGRESE